jgi:putative flippase GtrA
MINVINKSNISRFARFAIVGGVNTAVDLGVLNLLIALFGVANPFIFSIYKGISFVCAVVNSYFMNKYFTFGHRQNSRKIFYVFVFFSLIGFVINVTISSVVFYVLGFYSHIFSDHIIATISGIIGNIFGLAINYINYSYFVFK